MNKYAPAAHWNKTFKDMKDKGVDLDWDQQWIAPFIEPLRTANAISIVDLGCGSGNDVLRLAKNGFSVVGLDYSSEAISQAKMKAIKDIQVEFVVSDLAEPLPFPDQEFDAVMSNVALHMFDARTTENIFNEVSRVTKKEGLFLFHVNSTEDRPNRAKRHPQDFEIDTNFIQEKDGQTMRFFSKDDLNALLQDFEEVHLELIQIKHFETGEPFKSVWRGICLK